MEEREGLADQLFSALAFRGDAGSYVSSGDNCLLGARCFRHEGIKPLFYRDSDAVVFEGEIYNREELIEDLQLSKEAGEGEIVLDLYKRDGLDFPRRINGIFAAALHDGENQRFVLARDHVGSRSLYYVKNRQGILFATTIKALLDTGIVDQSLSLYGVHSYFCSTAISPPDTIYSEVKALRPAASICFFGNGDVREHVYWPIKDVQEDQRRSIEDFSEELRGLLLDSIKIRARCGGRYGSIVSGGVDSSFVSAVLTHELSSGDKLPVFSVDFAEALYSDAHLQKTMYETFPLHPHRATMSSDEYWNILNMGVRNLDTPVNDDAFAGMYKVFNLARSVGCTALFEGEAADELFFTGHVHSERRLQKYLLFPATLRKLLFGTTVKTSAIGGTPLNKVERFFFRMGIDDTERRLMVLPSFYRTKRFILQKGCVQIDHDPLQTARAYLNETRLRNPLNIYYYGLMKNFLPDDLLYKNERMASANSITNRTPFIDYRLVELALSMPQRYKVRRPTAADDGTKIVYKKAIEGIIPDRILHRRKDHGFSMPSSEWYKTALRERIDDLILGSKAKHADYIDSSYVKDLHRSYMSGTAGLEWIFRSVLIFELWLRQQKYWQ